MDELGTCLKLLLPEQFDLAWVCVRKPIQEAGWTRSTVAKKSNQKKKKLSAKFHSFHDNYSQYIENPNFIFKAAIFNEKRHFVSSLLPFIQFLFLQIPLTAHPYMHVLIMATCRTRKRKKRKRQNHRYANDNEAHRLLAQVDSRVRWTIPFSVVHRSRNQHYWTMWIIFSWSKFIISIFLFRSACSDTPIRSGSSSYRFATQSPHKN